MEKRDSFIIRTSLEELNGVRVDTGPSVSFSFHDEKDKLVSIRMRKLAWVDDEKVNGLWVEEGYLLPFEDDSSEGDFNLEFVRELHFLIKDCQMSLIEYKDRCQYSIMVGFLKEPQTISSGYKSYNSFGSIKWLMENVKTKEDVFNLVSELEKIQ